MEKRQYYEQVWDYSCGAVMAFNHFSFKTTSNLICTKYSTGKLRNTWRILLKTWRILLKTWRILLKIIFIFSKPLKIIQQSPSPLCLKINGGLQQVQGAYIDCCDQVEAQSILGFISSYYTTRKLFVIHKGTSKN